MRQGEARYSVTAGGLHAGGDCFDRDADGFFGYEVMDGNTWSRKRCSILDRIEKAYGQARRVWVIGRGIPTEATLKKMRERKISYLVGTPKGSINKHEKQWLELPWKQVRDSVQVKLYEHQAELYVLARSDGRQAKEIAIRRKRLVRLLRKLRAMRRSLPGRDQLLLRIGAARKEAGRAFGFVTIALPAATETVTRASFHFRIDKVKLRQAEQRDGHSVAVESDSGRSGGAVDPLYPADEYRGGIRSLKSDLGLRPIHHRLERRVEAHISWPSSLIVCR